MPFVPPAMAAVERFPTLRHALPALAPQQRRITERLRHVVPRPELVAELDTLVGELGGGLLLLEGAPGAGATTLLCQLAAERACPFWLADTSPSQGLAALAAQVIALHELPVPLVPPAADRDTLTLEHLIGEAATQHASTNPLLLLVDAPTSQSMPFPPALPMRLPQGAVLIYACAPGQYPDADNAARLRLPSSGPVLIRALVDAALARGAPKALASALAAHSGRSFLYVALAHGLLERGVLRRRALPEGLAALHGEWWHGLDAAGQRLARSLAAAGEPLPLPLAASIAQIELEQIAALAEQWGPLLETHENALALYHTATQAFIASQGSLAETHETFVGMASRQMGELFAQHEASEAYLYRQLARHCALSGGGVCAENAPLLVQRVWALGQERRSGSLRPAAEDAAWVSFAASSEPELMVRSTLIGGTLATLARHIAPEDAASATVLALDQGVPRDVALRRVRNTIDQLADGRDKALVLRRLGEVCFERGIKSQAMRMLAEALDLEVPGTPRSWRDEREEAQVALARAAIDADAPDRALGITVRIAHAERRGMIETEVVRYLIHRGSLTRAEEVAHAIGHEHTHEWAMAEVAAGHARAGNNRRFREVLGTLKTENAIAWARTELASDAARRGDTSAVEQVGLIANERLRDQAFGLVAQALVVGRQPASALIAARLIGDREIRARTLIDLALLRPPNTAIALGLAFEDARALGDELRLPMLVLLATAYASVGNLVSALNTVALLEEGEERDRGHSRIAAALARAGELDTAARIANAIPDEDERGWTLRELVIAYAANGHLDRATSLLEGITDPEQQDRSRADLCIARARAGRVAGALTSIEKIGLASERARALGGMAEPMVARGFEARAEAARDLIGDTAARSRYTLALVGALAAAGQRDPAERLALTAERPLDQVRALLVCARFADNAHAARLLGQAMRMAAALGRTTSITALTSATDLLVRIGGAELLLNAAHTLDEVDGWWS